MSHRRLDEGLSRLHAIWEEVKVPERGQRRGALARKEGACRREHARVAGWLKEGRGVTSRDADRHEAVVQRRVEHVGRMPWALNDKRNEPFGWVPECEPAPARRRPSAALRQCDCSSSSSPRSSRAAARGESRPRCPRRRAPRQPRPHRHGSADRARTRPAADRTETRPSRPRATRGRRRGAIRHPWADPSGLPVARREVRKVDAPAPRVGRAAKPAEERPSVTPAATPATSSSRRLTRPPSMAGMLVDVVRRRAGSASLALAPGRSSRRGSCARSAEAASSNTPVASAPSVPSSASTTSSTVRSSGRARTSSRP